VSYRIFLLSPAYCGGERARMLMSGRASFDLARRLRRPEGAPLGEVFAFLSGLYFRGKLAYALTFARPPEGTRGALVITPTAGLLPVEEPVTARTLQRFAEVAVDSEEPRYRRPLVRDARRLLRAITATAPGDAPSELVLLGSVATEKYVRPLVEIFGDRLLFPVDFVGRGDMSRGGLMLRSVAAGQELPYVPVIGAVRHGPRPPRLPRLPRKYDQGGPAGPTEDSG